MWELAIPAIAGAIGSMGGSAIGGAMNAKMQEDAQRFEEQQSDIARGWNEEMFDKSMSFNSGQAAMSRNFTKGQDRTGRIFNHKESEINRDFQERMRATQYQTAIGDMKRAGLNPMLAYSQGGSGNVSGSAASAHPSGAGGAASVGTPSSPKGSSPLAHINVADFGASAIELAKGVQEVRNLKSTEGLIDAQTRATDAQAGQSTASAAELNGRLKRIASEMAELDSRTVKNLTGAQLDSANSNLAIAREQLTGQHGNLAEAEIALKKVEATLAGLAVPRARNEANAQGSWWMKEIAPYMGEMGKMFNGAAAIRGIAR